MNPDRCYDLTADGDRVAALLRLAVQASSLGILGYVVRNVADELAMHGLTAAQAWLRGYWYSAGNRDPKNHPTVLRIQTVLGLRIVTTGG